MKIGDTVHIISKSVGDNQRSPDSRMAAAKLIAIFEPGSDEFHRYSLTMQTRERVYVCNGNFYLRRDIKELDDFQLELFGVKNAYS